MGKRFRLVEIRVVMDGQELSHRLAAKGTELDAQQRLYEGDVTPGLHNLTVTLSYEGRNTGPFTYLDDYKFRLESTGTFMAQEVGRPASIEVLAYQKPGATVPVEQKPTMEIKAVPGSGMSAAFPAPEPARR
jgi:hypothetical protein